MKKELSILLVIHNEEKILDECLNKLGFADEIVIILDNCSDNSKNICLKYTNNIHEGNWNIEGQRRNYGISKCKSEWILEVDADEVLNKNLEIEITKRINRNEADFFYIPLVNYIGKKKINKGWMACLAPDGKFCLFKNGCKKWKEGLVHPDYILCGKKGTPLSNKIDHYMSKNISDLLIRFNKNTSLYAKELDLKKIERLLSIRKIFSRFCKSYIFRGGIKNGGIGILIGLLCAIYPYVSAVKHKDK